MKNKKGFTLIELLAVIALLAALVIFVVPNVINYFRSGERNLLSLQEKNVADAAKLYLEDYCKNPINYNFVCPLNHKDVYDTSGKNINKRKYFGTLKVSELIYEGYLEDVKFKEKDCATKSYITYEEDGTITAYLCCEYINNNTCTYNSNSWNLDKYSNAIGDE